MQDQIKKSTFPLNKKSIITLFEYKINNLVHIRYYDNCISCFSKKCLKKRIIKSKTQNCTQVKKPKIKNVFFFGAINIFFISNFLTILQLSIKNIYSF